MSSEDLKDIAQKLYNEQFVSIQPEEYIQFLAANDDDSEIIRQYYMDLFNWNPNLLKSTRLLCSKLYLKGESQELDRILTSFTKSYIKQNPVNVFCTKNFEKIYIVLYSLILLNTSLHNSEVNKKSKINQSDYIRNTFTTFIQQDPKILKKLSIKQRITIERELANYYDDLARHELHLKQDEGDTSTSNAKPMDSTITTTNAAATPSSPGPAASPKSPSLSRQISNSSVWSSDTNRNSLNMKRMSSATSSVSHFTVSNQSNRPSNNRVGFTRALMSDQNNHRFYQQSNGSMVSNNTFVVRNRQSLDKLRSVSGSSSAGASATINRRSSRNSIISTASTTQDDSMSVVSYEDASEIPDINVDDSHHQHQNLDQFNVNEYQDKYDLTLELQGSPYLKEGLLKLKILNNDQQDNNIPETPVASNASTTTTSSQSTSSRFFSFFRGRSNTESTSTNTSSNPTASILSNKYADYFVVVSKGELNLYSFDPKVIKKHEQRLRKIKQKQQKQLISFDGLDDGDDGDDLSSVRDSKGDADVGDGNWLKNAANVGNYNLCSTFAQLEKPSIHGSKKPFGSVFTLTFPKILKLANKKFVFEAGTKEIALEFINTCNYWASKITAIPTFEESVSSIEYGWTNLQGLIDNKANFKKLKNIQKWEVLPRGTYLSYYNDNYQEDHYQMMKQFIKTLNYYNNLKRHFKEFSDTKVKFVKHFSPYSNTSNYAKLISNYDAKLNEYKFELKQYKNYLIMLGFGLQLRFDLEEEEKLMKEEDEKLAEEDSKDKDSKDESSQTSGSITDTVTANSAPQSPKKELMENEDSELTKIVKYEIRKLFVGLKDVGRIIPTFQTSKSISNLNDLQNQIPNLTVNDFNNSFSLVKSPKTYTLSNYNDNESPITQLLQSSGQKNNGDMVPSFSTNTIKEEDEPEEKLDDKTTKE